MGHHLIDIETDVVLTDANITMFLTTLNHSYVLGGTFQRFLPYLSAENPIIALFPGLVSRRNGFEHLVTQPMKPSRGRPVVMKALSSLELVAIVEEVDNGLWMAFYTAFLKPAPHKSSLVSFPSFEE